MPGNRLRQVEDFVTQALTNPTGCNWVMRRKTKLILKTERWMSHKNSVIQKCINNTEFHLIFLKSLGGANLILNSKIPCTGLFGVSINKVSLCRTVGLAFAKVKLQNQDSSLGAFRGMFKTLQILLEQETHTYTPTPSSPPTASLLPRKTTVSFPLSLSSFSYLRFGWHWNAINTSYEATVIRYKKKLYQCLKCNFSQNQGPRFPYAVLKVPSSPCTAGTETCSLFLIYNHWRVQ